MRIVEASGRRSLGGTRFHRERSIFWPLKDSSRKSWPKRTCHPLEQTDVANFMNWRGALRDWLPRLAAVASARPDYIAGNRRCDAAIGKRGNCEELLDCDLRFHLELCDLSAIPTSSSTPVASCCPFLRLCACAWLQRRHLGMDLTWKPPHQRIIDLIREGEGAVAEQYVKKAMERFLKPHTTTGRRRLPHAG